MSAESSYNNSYQVKERMSDRDIHSNQPWSPAVQPRQTRDYHLSHLLHVGSSHQLGSEEKVLSVCLLQVQE